MRKLSGVFRCFIINREVNILANIKSAKKRIKVIKAKTLRNKMAHNQLRTIIKKYYAAVESGDKEAAKSAYLLAVKKVDQAAAHKKSQFTKALNAMA